MVVLKRINSGYRYTNEAKQVGRIYHVTTLEGVANYIAPDDTLKGSGKYHNWLLGGSTDVVSFTRDKSFVVSTRVTRQAPVLFDFEVDGDRLSENHKIISYNDLAFDKKTGEFDNFPTLPKLLEHEEVVQGSIHPFSKFVKSVRYCVSIRDMDDIDIIHDDLQKCKSYLSRFSITYDAKLKEKLSSPLYNVTFPSFDSFVSTIESIMDLLNNRKNPIDESSVKTAFQYFSKELLDHLAQMESNNTESDPYILEVLDIAIAQQNGGDSAFAKKARLRYSQIEKFISKDKFLGSYIDSRLDKYCRDSYMDYPLEDKLTLLLKYGKFDSEQFYTIANIAKTWFNKHPEDIDCGTYGKLKESDFEDKSNVSKLLNYLYQNYDSRKINSVLFDIILMDGRSIAKQEFADLDDPKIYTLGVSTLKGNDLFENLTTWSDIFTEKELLDILRAL